MVKRLLLLLLSCYIVLLDANAWSGVSPSGAKSIAKCNASVAYVDVWSVVHNPACLSNFESITCAVDYENRFLLPEMSLKSAVAVLPSQLCNFSVFYMDFGLPAWRESQMKLSFSRRFGHRVGCGLQFSYKSQKLPERGGLASSFGFDMGAVVSISKKTDIGISVFDLANSHFRVDEVVEFIPRIIRIGGRSDLSSSVSVGYELCKYETETADFRFGVDWKAAERFNIRVGCDSRICLAAGLGFELGVVTVDFACSYHQFLGYSPSISLQIERK